MSEASPEPVPGETDEPAPPEAVTEAGEDGPAAAEDAVGAATPGAGDPAPGDGTDDDPKDGAGGDAAPPDDAEPPENEDPVPEPDDPAPGAEEGGDAAPPDDAEPPEKEDPAPEPDDPAPGAEEGGDAAPADDAEPPGGDAAPEPDDPAPGDGTGDDPAPADDAEPPGDDAVPEPDDPAPADDAEPPGDDVAPEPDDPAPGDGAGGDASPGDDKSESPATGGIPYPTQNEDAVKKADDPAPGDDTSDGPKDGTGDDPTPADDAEPLFGDTVPKPNGQALVDVTEADDAPGGGGNDGGYVGSDTVASGPIVVEQEIGEIELVPVQLREGSKEAPRYRMGGKAVGKGAPNFYNDPASAPNRQPPEVIPMSPTSSVLQSPLHQDRLRRKNPPDSSVPIASADTVPHVPKHANQQNTAHPRRPAPAEYRSDDVGAEERYCKRWDVSRAKDLMTYSPPLITRNPKYQHVKGKVRKTDWSPRRERRDRAARKMDGYEIVEVLPPPRMASSKKTKLQQWQTEQSQQHPSRYRGTGLTITNNGVVKRKRRSNLPPIGGSGRNSPEIPLLPGKKKKAKETTTQNIQHLRPVSNAKTPIGGPALQPGGMQQPTNQKLVDRNGMNRDRPRRHQGSRSPEARSIYAVGSPARSQAEYPFSSGDRPPRRHRGSVSPRPRDRAVGPLEYLGHSPAQSASQNHNSLQMHSQKHHTLPPLGGGAILDESTRQAGRGLERSGGNRAHPKKTILNPPHQRLNPVSSPGKAPFNPPGSPRPGFGSPAKAYPQKKDIEPHGVAASPGKIGYHHNFNQGAPPVGAAYNPIQPHMYAPVNASLNPHPNGFQYDPLKVGAPGHPPFPHPVGQAGHAYPLLVPRPPLLALHTNGPTLGKYPVMPQLLSPLASLSGPVHGTTGVVQPPLPYVPSPLQPHEPVSVSVHAQHGAIIQDDIGADERWQSLSVPGQPNFQHNMTQQANHSVAANYPFAVQHGDLAHNPVGWQTHPYQQVSEPYSHTTHPLALQNQGPGARPSQGTEIAAHPIGPHVAPLTTSHENGTQARNPSPNLDRAKNMIQEPVSVPHQDYLHHASPMDFGRNGGDMVVHNNDEQNHKSPDSPVGGGPPVATYQDTLQIGQTPTGAGRLGGNDPEPDNISRPSVPGSGVSGDAQRPSGHSSKVLPEDPEVSSSNNSGVHVLSAPGPGKRGSLPKLKLLKPIAESIKSPPRKTTQF